MHSTQSRATSESNDAGKTEQAAPHSKDTDIDRWVNIEMVQNVLLIWLDKNIDKNNNDFQNAISQLQKIVNNINVFMDGELCVEFVNNINDEKACIIIGDSFAQEIVPRIHDISQVARIFISSDSKKQHEQWIKGWSKIDGLFTEVSSICDALKQAANQCERNATPIGFIFTDSDLSKKTLNQLDCSFMYTQIMKDILLTIKFEDDHIKKFIEHCCDVFANNSGQLITVKEMEQNYRKQSPIWWYSRHSFLYPMLNHALRIMNADVIIKMGFFIYDLHRQIEQLHNEQFISQPMSEIFVVYRGQGLSKMNFEQMSRTNGGLISFNNFLSTSKYRDVSFAFGESNKANPDLVGILFVITIDPSNCTTPFASIRDVSNFVDEDEVLFSMHSVFRVNDVKPMDESQRLFQVDLTLTTDNDKDLRVLTEHIREEIDPDSKEWHRLGKLLIIIGQHDKAQQVYETLLNQAADDIEKAVSYHHIGWAKHGKGENDEAIKFLEQAIKIRQETLPSHHPDLAKSYNQIGLTYCNIGEYEKAISSLKKALEINQLIPTNHLDLAKSYNNIGLVYYVMGECEKALPYYEKSLEIYEKSLPPIHPDLAGSYNNIGLVCDGIGEYSKALSYCEKALEIHQKSLPSNHPELGNCYNNIGLAYYHMREYSNAISNYEKDLEIQKESQLSNHPNLAKSYDNIGKAYGGMGQYSKQLQLHEKALEIRQQSLPLNHPDLAQSFNSIGTVYVSMNDYSKALPFFERAVNIGQESLPPNNPRLQKWRNSLESVTRKL
ncbi:unnamed protein product [Adineta steineri]|uniref:Kinesin light chain n=1 Tax=Adineta steineri TaxID=433720 RepID=A0A813Y0Z5_9BILA|nr:unnamed protein product [Adineta steineri]CAF3899098.1 unnamed protein product [Adineta steineri]